MKVETGQYYTVERRKEVADSARKLRRQFLRYKEAEIVYSIQHKKLLELAGKAGALVLRSWDSSVARQSRYIVRMVS